MYKVRVLVSALAMILLMASSSWAAGTVLSDANAITGSADQLSIYNTRGELSVSVRTDSYYYRIGDTVYVSVQVRDHTSSPVQGALVEVYIYLPMGLIFLGHDETDHLGLATVSFYLDSATCDPGLYPVDAVAMYLDYQSGYASTSFEVLGW